MRFFKPHARFKAEYLDMMDDWHHSKEELVPFTLEFDHSDFETFVQRLINYEIEADSGFVCHSTYWLFDDAGVLVGVSNIRHELNEHLVNHGGHIGFGIRPSFRKRGYATEILKLSLQKVKAMQIDKALVTCAKRNVGSQKTILNNNGVFAKEHFFHGEMTRLYWIDLSSS